VIEVRRRKKKEKKRKKKEKKKRMKNEDERTKSCQVRVFVLNGAWPLLDLNQPRGLCGLVPFCVLTQQISMTRNQTHLGV